MADVVAPAATAGRRPARAEDGDSIPAWREVFELLQDSGLSDRGAHYALAVTSLKRKAEDVQQQLEGLRQAESSLLQAARDEAKAIAARQGEPRPERCPKRARAWGMSAAEALARQAREAAARSAAEEPPYAPTQLSHEAQTQVHELFEAQRKAEAEQQAQALAQAEQTLSMQAEVFAQAQAAAEAQAKALSDAQVQAEVMAQMQQQLQDQVQQASQAQEVLQLMEVDRAQLRHRGLNSKKLPMRPGMAPCQFFMRNGNCKYGQQCKWDHPELSIGPKGLPRRPGDQPCAFYLRTGACKFGLTCKFDHPESLEGLTVPAAPAGLDDGTAAAQLAALAQVLSQAAAFEGLAKVSAVPTLPSADAQQQLLALLSSLQDSQALEAAAALLVPKLG